MQRPSTPYNDPNVQGPQAQRLARGKVQDLRKMMNQTTVNKTALHPGGVAYVPFTSPNSSLGEVLFRRATADMCLFAVLTLRITLSSVRTTPTREDTPLLHNNGRMGLTGRLTVEQRSSCTRRLTSTTTALQLYV